MEGRGGHDEGAAIPGVRRVRARFDFRVDRTCSCNIRCAVAASVAFGFSLKYVPAKGGRLPFGSKAAAVDQQREGGREAGKSFAFWSVFVGKVVALSYSRLVKVVTVAFRVSLAYDDGGGDKGEVIITSERSCVLCVCVCERKWGARGSGARGKSFFGLMLLSSMK